MIRGDLRRARPASIAAAVGATAPSFAGRRIAAGSDRVDRGGGWDNGAVDCRSANRDGDAPGYRHDNVGFRLVRVGP